MYVASWIFLLAAIGSLAFGLSQPGLTFIYVSIGASVVAMVFLLAGVLRKRPVEPATAGAPYGPPPEEAAAEPTPAVATRPAGRQAAGAPQERPQRKPAAAAAREAPAESRAAAEATAAEAEEAPAPAPAPAPAQKTTAKKTAAKKTAAKKTAAKTGTRKSTARGGAEVVAIPERGTYHQATCRFVKGRRDTEKLGKTTAKRRGYNACGVCKPDAA